MSIYRVLLLRSGVFYTLCWDFKFRANPEKPRFFKTRIEARKYAMTLFKGESRDEFYTYGNAEKVKVK